MSIQVVEIVVKCQVPHMESEEYVIGLRAGERLVSVPKGFACVDAYDTHENCDSETTIIRVHYRPCQMEARVITPDAGELRWTGRALCSSEVQ